MFWYLFTMDVSPVSSGALSDAVWDTAVADVILSHAVAVVGGEAAAIHRRGVSMLHMVAARGLSDAVVERWRKLPEESSHAPALAVSGGRVVWRQGDESSMGELEVDEKGGGGGLMSVPLLDDGEAVGALTVRFDSGAEPDAEQQEIMRMVARWTLDGLRGGAWPSLHLEEPPSAAAADGRHVLEAPDGDRDGLGLVFPANRIGAWLWHPKSGKLQLDATARELLGLEHESFDERIESWLRLIHPDDLPAVSEEMEKAVRALGRYDVEYRILRPDGTTGWIQERSRVVPDANGEPGHVVGAVWDTTDSTIDRDGARRALRYMSDGFLSVDGDWRISFANVEAELLLHEGRALTGWRLWDVPAVHALDVEDHCRRTAAGTKSTRLDLPWPGSERWYRFRFVPSPDGMAWYFTDVTERVRQRARQAAADRTVVERRSRVEELTAALAEAVTTRDVVGAVAERVLPPFGASGLVIHAVESHRMRVVGAVNYPQEFLTRLDELPLLRIPEVANRLNRFEPWYIGSPEEFSREYPQLTWILEQIPYKSWAFLPLAVSGRLVGLCVVAFREQRSLTGEERALLFALTGLVAQSLERARLYDAEHVRAEELQRGLLPPEIPSLPAVSAAVRYLSGEVRMDVGGDWYDVLPLSADRVALVIGDVMGHGLPQAITMGRLRTAVRTLSDLELPPDEIFGHLNDLIAGLPGNFFATCLYAVYDPTTRTCTLARAGHPPPAVVLPNGDVSFLESSPDPPLGAAEPPFETVELPVEEGSLLVFYTDGLVESVNRDIDSGMRQLADVLTTHHGESLETLCGAVTDALLPGDQRGADDAALMAVRLNGTPEDRIAFWTLPDDPQAAGIAREHVRRQLCAWHLEDLVTTTELVASELVGNVVRHATGPVGLRLLHSRTLVCEVSDGSLTTPRIRRATWTDEGGRGLQLISALSERWGTRSTIGGKCIWTEQALP